MLSQKLDTALNFGCELCTQTTTPLFIPQGSFLELPARRASKNDAPGHFLRRSEIEAFTSSQGTTSLGFAS